MDEADFTHVLLRIADVPQRRYMKGLLVESGMVDRIDFFDLARIPEDGSFSSYRTRHIFAASSPSDDEFWQYARSLKMGYGPRLTLISFDLDWTAFAAAAQTGATSYINARSSPDEHRKALRMILGGRVYFPFADMKASAAPDPAPLPQLTLRQRNVFSLLCRGATNAQISRSLGISENTARLHVSAILKAFGVSNRTAVVAAAQGNQ